MIKARKIVTAMALLGTCFLLPSYASAAPGPAWQLSLVALPTNLESGTTGSDENAPVYEALATNIGAGDASGPVTFTVTLPVGVAPVFSSTLPLGISTDNTVSGPSCAKGTGQTVTCTASGPVHPSRLIGVKIPVEVSGALQSGEVLPDATASLESPGTTTVTASTPTTIDSQPPPFGFLSAPAGLAALFTRADGSAEAQAGAHPNQLTINLGFPVDQPGGFGPTTGAGHLRDVITDLPPGVVVNPNATQVRCTEVELLRVEPSCPAESQVGTVTVMTEVTGPQPVSSPLYNMVPPPGSPASFVFDVAGAGIFQHLSGGVRSESDFGLSSAAHDVLARALNPVEDVQAQLWGDPTAESHDEIRSVCGGRIVPEKCPVKRLDVPFLTMPSACSQGLTFAAHARSWEEAEEGAGLDPAPHNVSAAATDLVGEPTEVNGCSLLEFHPTLTLRPETDAAESPTGVEVKLDVPQEESEGRSPSDLKDVKVSFPEGMAVNPAAAKGLQACSPGQIGLKTPVGDTSPSFTEAAPQCPAASKIGTVEVSTPLLDHTLPGSVYVMQPYANPFGTLLGVYVVVDSPEDGIVVKLAGRTEADPNTGRLTTTFTENPQLPVGEFKVNLFGGTRAALRTPSTCGTFTTDSVLSPWSGNPAAHESDSFQITRGANGAPCVSSEAEMPNHPGFEAGTDTPLAASYSPFRGRLTRSDGEQQLKGLNLTMPLGLTGKLAGVRTCSEAAIAAAATKSGQEELANPSCPASAQIGEAEVGAGAGPTPFYTKGKIYLAGPYAGAPISGVVITPAVAGPFDLGTVVVRAPAYVDPLTAQLRLRSDAFPHILQGIPLELRDARVFLDRSQFTLNPSNCDPMSVSGEAISLLGGSASLSQRFQVGGCRGLAYEPKLFLRLNGGTKRGAHPKLRAVLESKPGEEANTARASVALPRSEFLENAHIQTVCTRVQFAAHNCPQGSIYGYARAITPLLDEPVEGPVYLRSSSHKLPDMVAALHGPPDKPIELELVGRIDSIRGGIRSTFDLVPDQPVNKFILNMFGGKKGLIINSRDVCAHTYRAVANFNGQNGKIHDFQPPLKASCSKPGKKVARH
jgi:hypothetical protein